MINHETKDTFKGWCYNYEKSPLKDRELRSSMLELFCFSLCFVLVHQIIQKTLTIVKVASKWLVNTTYFSN